MTGLYEFIIESKDPFKREHTFSTGDKIYIDPTINQQHWSKRIAKVVSVPLKYRCEIAPGDEVLVVDTVFFKKARQGAYMMKSHFLIDQEKGWYRVPKDLVIMYRKPGGEWQCYGNNIMVEPVMDTWKTQQGLVVVDTEYKKEVREQGSKKQYGRIAYSNTELEEMGVAVGDVVFYDDQVDYRFELDGKPYYNLINRHVLGKVNNEI